ncbi:MAG: hypothetical protein ACXVRP_13715, partial [Solirubrobacteraceae bacterium]
MAITTTELALRQVRPALLGRTLCTHATVLDLGPPMALAEVTLSDDSGALLARGGSLCVQLPFTADGDGAGGGGGDDHDDTGPADELTETGPDPWERPAPEAGLGRLTGLRRVALAEGAATFALPVTRWLCAPPPGRAQGGA